MMDETNTAIIQLLQEDSRYSPREIARLLKKRMNIDISFSTVRRRIKELESKNIIIGYTTIVDPSYLNLNYPICFFIETNPKTDINKIAEELITCVPELLYIHQVAGDFQLACLARCVDAESAAKLSRRIAQIEGIQKIVSHAILRTFKEDIRFNLAESPSCLSL